MAAIDELNTNLNNLEETVLSLKETQLGLPTIDFAKFFLTERQAIKKQ